MLTRISAKYIVTWSVILNIGLFITVVVEIEANEVEFTVSTDVALVGDEVDFICSPPNFDPDNDELTIRFEGDVLLRFKDNTPMYEIGADMYYTVEMVSNQELHLTINVANVSDSGDYFCAIFKTTSGRSLTSSSVSLLVQYFQSPACFLPGNPAIEYSSETGTLKMERGIDITLYCQGTGDGITINWSRSDNKDIIMATKVSEMLKSVSFTSSPNDHCVDFKCSSSSSMYPDISYACVISVFTLNITENPCPTQIPSTEEPINTNATTPVQTESQVSLLLIIGASAAAGVLFLILLVIIICIVMVRYKRKHKRLSLDLHLATPRPSHDIDNLPRFSIDSFDSDIDMSPRQGRKSTTSYENNNLSFYNQVDIGELTQTDSKLTTDSLNSRISYDNNEKGHFVLPPLKEDTKESDDQYPPSYGPIYDKTPDDTDGRMRDGAENSASPPGSPGSSSIHPPVYADVKKNKNRTISSVLSDEDNTTPTYAFVNKGSQKNNDESKRLSRLPYAYTEDDEETAENETKEGNGLQYAGSVNYSEVEFY